MAVLAVAGAGAALGLGIGAAAGLTTFAALATAASIGFSIGTVAGQLMFPEKIKQEGSRLNDLAVSSSAFGAVRPVIYGQVRIGGNVIWATPIREQKTTTHSGKGGPSITNTSYTYYGNFALALCEGPVEAVIRIWADSKLIYDVTGAQLMQAEGVNFRFYSGDETQLPDSIIEADKGVGNVPGYRGTCYIVFDDLPLADYGNRLPNITCEVVTVQDPAFPYEVLTEAAPSTMFGTDSTPKNGLAIDWDRGLAYWQGQNPFGLVVADAVTLRTIREVPMTEVLTDGTDGGFAIDRMIVGPDGALYFVSSPGIIRVDQNTLTQTAVFSDAGSIFGFTSTGFSFPQYFASISTLTPTGETVDYLMVLGFWQQWGVLSIPELEHQAHGSVDFGGFPGGATKGKSEIGIGEAWGIWHPGALGSSHMWINKVRVELETFTNTTAASFVPTDFDPTATMFSGFATGQFIVYDETDDSLVFGFTLGNSLSNLRGWVAKWSEASGIVWATDLSAAGVPSAYLGPAGELSGESRVTHGTLAWFTYGGLVQISTVTGAVLINQTSAPTVGEWPIGMSGTVQIYDSETQIVLGHFNSHVAGVTVPGPVAKAFIGRKTGGHTTLENIVTDQCRRAGFEDADFDATALTDVIQGYVISQRASGTDVLTPLLSAYLCDAVETDYALKFKHRADATIASIIQDELVRTDAQADSFSETRQQEIELPMRLTVTYIDKDRDYQQNTAAAKRIRNPDPTVFTDNQIDLNLAVVSTSTPSKQMAEVLLYTAWNERHTFATRLPPKYDYLDPGDPVQLTLADGYTARVRLAGTSLGVDYSLETKLIGETDGQYVSTAEADPGVPWFGSSYIRAAGKSELILLDVPLLRDIDDLGGVAVRGYWTGGPYSRFTAWPGAVLQEATPSATWETIDSVTNEGCWGYLQTAPEDWPPIFATQDELHGGVMQVGIIGGTFIPSSTTDEGLANGANALAVIKTNGQVEVIQYRDATALADGRWQLSTLRRGLRGTDTMCFGHTSGEIFVFLDATLIDFLTVPLVQRNVVELWRLVTVGMLPSNALVEPFTFHGRDMMPYAPVNAQRTHVGADGIMTWTRRTRIGGMLEDGTDTVPLHEASEAYEAYFLADEAAAVDFDPTDPATYLRAFTGLTAPTLTYTAAMMAADSFDPVTDTVYAAIFQISAVVGRGFSSLHVLPPLGALSVGLEDGTGDWDGWTWG